jgi:hypothetical protein
MEEGIEMDEDHRTESRVAIELQEPAARVQGRCAQIFFSILREIREIRGSLWFASLLKKLIEGCT